MSCLSITNSKKFDLFTVDKISFRFEKKGLVCDEIFENKILYKKNTCVTYMEYGIYGFLHFHDTCFDIDFTFIENILNAVYEIQASEKPLFKREIDEEFFYDNFTLTELEIAFDFYSRSVPFEFSLKKCNIYFKNRSKPWTLYSPDYRQIIRKSGKNAGAVKKTYKSLICYYDRGLRLKSKQNIMRFEFRLTDKRYLKNIKTEDLDIYHNELAVFLKPKLIKFIKRAVKNDTTFIYDISFVRMKKYHPYLLDVFLGVGFKLIGFYDKK